MKQTLIYTITLSSMLLLIGCGGGGGKESSVPTIEVRATAISPLEAIQGQKTNFTVTGNHLNENDVTLSLVDCNDLSITSKSQTQLVFSCTPRNTGNKAFSLKHKNNTVFSQNITFKAQNVAAQIANLENSGAIPKLDRSDSLTGSDANNNGVRDDIDAYITANYSVANQKAAALQTAKALQSTLTVDISNIESVKEINRTVSRGIDCIFTVFTDNSSQNPTQAAQELESITTNTKSRLIAYLKYNKALDGTSSALTEGDSCE